jgi:hypothetical protein
VLSASEHGQGAATPQPPQAAEVPVPALALAAPAEAAPAPPATAQEPPEDLVCPITGARTVLPKWYRRDDCRQGDTPGPCSPASAADVPQAPYLAAAAGQAQNCA